MPVSSHLPPLTIPDLDIWSFLFSRPGIPYPERHTLLIEPGPGGDTSPGSTHLRRSARSYTFSDLRRSSIGLAHELSTRFDFGPGSVLGVYSPNTIDTAVAMWAALWAGAVVSPANPGYTVKELAFQLKDSGASVLAAHPAHLDIAVKAAAEAGLPSQAIFLIGPRDKEAETRFRHMSDLVIAGIGTRSDPQLIATVRPKEVKPETDLAFLVYSSGTTGHPKGVMLSHRNIVANILQVTAGEESRMRWNGGPDGTGDKALGFLPLFHIYGLTVVLHTCVYQGIPLVVMPTFTLDRFCSIIEQFRIVATYVVPPVVLLLSKHPLVSKYDLSSVQMMNSGAAPLTANLVDAVYDRLKIPIKQGYGLSETSPTTHVQSWADYSSAPGSVGKMLPGIEAKYMDGDGEREVPAGQAGELWVRGPNVFSGYLNRPDLSAAAFSPDGYFKTGDVGFVDRSGNFYITDRVKELIKYKGFQVAPAELEGVLVTHPDVDDAAVIGVYDETRASEIPRAYLVLRSTGSGSRSGSPAKAKEIVDWLATKVAAHKRLRGGVVFVEQVPKSPSGKILRRLLRDRAAAEAKAGAKPKL